LPPYAENPFNTIEIDRIPVEDAKPVVIFTPEQERQFLEARDDWQLPIFATLMLTGLRPGELTHLLLPGDLNLREGWLRVRNEPELGWQVKTRNERSVPLAPELVELLKIATAGRDTGPVFRRRRCVVGSERQLWNFTPEQLSEECRREIETSQQSGNGAMCRQQCQRIAQRLWVELGAIPEDRLRLQFMKLTRAIGLAHVTAPKTLRHLFATRLQEANVDPLVRNELMGHVPMGDGRAKGPLGMTAVYTHTSAATLRSQLERAMQARQASDVIRKWLAGSQNAAAVATA
jgi:integrase